VLLIPKRHRQTDRRTDGRTDERLTVALPRSALASRGKNGDNSTEKLCTDMTFAAVTKVRWSE